MHTCQMLVADDDADIQDVIALVLDDAADIVTRAMGSVSASWRQHSHDAVSGMMKRWRCCVPT